MIDLFFPPKIVVGKPSLVHMTGNSGEWDGKCRECGRSDTGFYKGSGRRCKECVKAYQKTVYRKR